MTKAFLLITVTTLLLSLVTNSADRPRLTFEGFRDVRIDIFFETPVKHRNENALTENRQPKYVTSFRAGHSGPVSYIKGCA